MIRTVSLAQTFGSFSDFWRPKIVGEVNDAHVKLVKLKGVSCPAARTQIHSQHRKRQE